MKNAQRKKTNGRGVRLLTRVCGACHGSSDPDWNRLSLASVCLHSGWKLDALPCDRVLVSVATMESPSARLELLCLAEPTKSCSAPSEWWMSAYGPSKHYMHPTPSVTTLDWMAVATAQSSWWSMVPEPLPLMKMMVRRTRHAFYAVGDRPMSP